MDIAFDILLTLHLLSILAAGAAVVGGPVIGARMATVAPEVRPTLGAIMQSLGRIAGISFGVLLITGVLMIWLRFGGVEGLSPWFWVKMVLVVVMAVGLALSRRLGRASPAANAIAWTSRIALVGIILAAVVAFN